MKYCDVSGPYLEWVLYACATACCLCRGEPLCSSHPFCANLGSGVLLHSTQTRLHATELFDTTSSRGSLSSSSCHGRMCCCDPVLNVLHFLGLFCSLCDLVRVSGRAAVMLSDPDLAWECPCLCHYLCDAIILCALYITLRRSCSMSLRTHMQTQLSAATLLLLALLREPCEP